MVKPIRHTQEMVDYYTAKGWWTPQTWPDIYDQNAKAYPDKVAFVDSRRQVTWKELKQITDRLALGFLELGLKKDDTVLWQLPNCIEIAAIRIALEKAGGISMYTAITVRETEIDHFLSKTNAVGAVTVAEYHGFNHFKLFDDLRKSGKYPHFKHIFVVGDKVPQGAISIEEMMQRPWEEKYPPDYLEKTKVNAYDVSLIMSTTGTTGLPKLVAFTTNCFRIHGRAYIERWGTSYTDSCLIIGPMFTGPTEPGILALPQVGGKCVVMETFEPEEALRLVERERITYISGFPILFIRMARVANIKDYDLSSLRFLCYAGAPFPAGAAEEVEAKLGVPILDFYGTLDSGMVFTADPDAPMERRTYRVGRVPPWDEIKVVDEKGNEVPVGEVGVLYWRGATGCGGFFGDPEKTKEAWGTLDMDGWFNTEDLAKVCEEGDVMLAGRARDMILRGGQNIYPLEIVNILSGHPKIADVQIIAMPDPDMGERACTFVVPRKGERFTFDEMISHLTEKNIAKYKLPERLEVMEEFPMVGDKINVRALGGYVAKKLVEEGKIGQDLANSWKEQGRIIL